MVVEKRHAETEVPRCDDNMDLRAGSSNRLKRDVL